MTAKDAIKYSMDTAMMVLQTYISDLNDAELLTRPAKGANHLAWQLGHLISSENQLINAVCPGACPELPAGFRDQHGKEATAVDDQSKFLKKQQYLDLFAAQRQGTKAALDKLPDAELDKPAPKEMQSYCPTVGAVFHLAGDHVLMHSGQFATVRRILGKPILI
jgi:hypothetical protein